MTSPAITPQCLLDLRAPSPIEASVRDLRGVRVNAALWRAIEALTGEANPALRAHMLAEILSGLRTPAAVETLKVAGSLALRGETAGLRLLFSFLEVKRTGLEVLQQVGALSSLERVSMRLASGSWTEPEETRQVRALFRILGTFRKATKAGAFDLGIEGLPPRPVAVKSLIVHLRQWYWQQIEQLESGRELPAVTVRVLRDIARLEVNLIERRVTQLARATDPSDHRGVQRLTAVVSFFTQDLDHIKAVLPRLSQGASLRERRLTMEATLPEGRLDDLQRGLLQNPTAAPVGRALARLRSKPLLDREMAFLVSHVHELALLRARLRSEPAPDFLSLMIGVLAGASVDGTLDVRVESEYAGRIWPIVRLRRGSQPAPDLFRVRFSEEAALDLVRPDGTPALLWEPDDERTGNLSFKELVQVQINNDSFILGVLANPKALVVPGLVAMIATMSRNLKVLDRIIRNRELHTGPLNRDVPRILLQNPARIPVKSLLPFINVRYIRRNDLEKLARAFCDIRPEVQKEIVAYMKAFRE